MSPVFHLHYDRSDVTFSLPDHNFLGFIEPETPPPLEDVLAAVEEALSHPIDSPPLEELLTPGDQVAIVVSDITRYSGANMFLPLLISRINQRGIPDREISIIFALGIHRPMSDDEQEQVVGKDIARRIRLMNHDCHDKDQLVSLGTTKRGTPVIINRRAAEADKLILTGTIGFHYLAGFGGGRKSILPGISSYEACIATHLLSLDPTKQGRHHRARTAVLDGNPLHEDMLDACAFLPPIFLFNTVLSPDAAFLHVVAGNLEHAFYAGCDYVRRHFVQAIAEPADMAIMSCGGFPKDINFIQAHKSLEHAIRAVKPGGVMIALAACSDGIGNPDFLNWLQFSDPQKLERELRRNFQINGQTACATLLKAQRVSIVLMSELPDSVVRSMSMFPAHSMEEALTKAYALMGEHPSTYVIPHGSVTLPWIDTNDHA